MVKPHCSNFRIITVISFPRFYDNLLVEVVSVGLMTVIAPPPPGFTLLPVLASLSRGLVELSCGFDLTAKILPSGVRM